MNTATSKRIYALPPLIANQIAAGEVIERPASVVKELLENSLDAEADTIHIDINAGGLNYIKVSDNGCGIVEEDLPLAIAAHATSKIVQLNDLYQISSMGFRGEALASIAAIAKVTISSKTAAQEHAMSLKFVNNKYQLEPCARALGTTVEVQDLFFNAPVRKRFLKSQSSEFLAIESLVKRFALSAPHITISLKHQDKLRFSVTAATCENTRKMRIQKILGKSFIEHAQYIEIERSGLKLIGWLCDANYQVSQNDKQLVYLNQRMVKDKLINHAIKQAYESILYPGRYPACLLYLSVPPAEVDVNVHPTKHEVRFQQPRLIHDFITSQIGLALGISAETYTTPNFSSKNLTICEPTNFYKEPISQEDWLKINSHYLLINKRDEYYLVDIHGAEHDRISNLLQEQPLPLKSRPLLVFIEYYNELISLEWFNEYQKKLFSFGIDIEKLSDHKIQIKSLPQAFPNLDIKRFLNELLDKSYVNNYDSNYINNYVNNYVPRLVRGIHTSDLYELFINYQTSNPWIPRTSRGTLHLKDPTVCEHPKACKDPKEPKNSEPPKSLEHPNSFEPQLKDFIDKALQNSHTPLWAIHLSPETCRGLFNA